jgi:hypothetical protein
MITITGQLRQPRTIAGHVTSKRLTGKVRPCWREVRGHTFSARSRLSFAAGPRGTASASGWQLPCARTLAWLYRAECWKADVCCDSRSMFKYFAANLHCSDWGEILLATCTHDGGGSAIVVHTDGLQVETVDFKCSKYHCHPNDAASGDVGKCRSSGHDVFSPIGYFFCVSMVLVSDACDRLTRSTRLGASTAFHLMPALCGLAGCNRYSCCNHWRSM